MADPTDPTDPGPAPSPDGPPPEWKPGMTQNYHNLVYFLIGFILILAIVFVMVVATDDDPSNKRVVTKATPTPVPNRVVKINPPGPIPPITADTDNQLEGEQQHSDAVPDANAPDLHEDMRDETPPGVSSTSLVAGQEKTEALAEKILKDPQAPAGAQAYSCPNKFVRNRSATNGPRVGTAIHFTVSSPGSLDAIRGLFNTPSFGASSNFGIELTGRCQTWVPKTEKAWAQGAANSAYFSIEIVTNDLTAAQWKAAPIIKNGILAALVRDLNRSVGAPLKLVNPVGCAWTPGITDHSRLECGNTHWDVGLHFPWKLFIKQVRNGTPSASASAHLTPGEKADVKCIKKKGKQPDCEARLHARNLELHKLGITSKNHRRARHTEIHRVLKRYS